MFPPLEGCADFARLEFEDPTVESVGLALVFWLLPLQFELVVLVADLALDNGEFLRLLTEAGGGVDGRDESDNGENQSCQCGEHTRREREVARLVIDGLSTQDIATALFISVHTVRDHLKTMFGKMGVSRRQDLAAVLTGRTPASAHVAS